MRPEIPLRPKTESPEANGEAHTNGHRVGDADGVTAEGTPQEKDNRLKRPNPEEHDQPSKKAKTSNGSLDEKVIVIEDAGGTIVID